MLKKSKLDWHALAQQAWEHYQNYLDSIDDENPDGDVDELHEIIQLLPEQCPSSKDQNTVTTWDELSSLLPMLQSVCYTILVEHAIAEQLQTNSSAENSKQIDAWFRRATECWDHPGAWSLAANFYGRIQKQTSLDAVSVARWYYHAAERAYQLRQQAIDYLQDEAKATDNKAWIEALVLHQMTGVELLEDEETWSESSVEATARFMAAMQYSTLQQHERAREQLQHFAISHRLHPNVWNGGTIATAKQQLPAMYHNVLPAPLYQRLCDIFAPDASFWTESDYDRRGYYSFYIDRKSCTQDRANVLSRAIITHVLPRVLAVLPNDPIVGFEWWVHHRPTGANLGHNLHFDTDEALLAQERKIAHPICSSVLYLTGDDKSGSTIVLDQNSDENQAEAQVAWRSVPTDNALFVFPGNLLHGVLPCPPLLASTMTPNSMPPSWDDVRQATKHENETCRPYRLTLLVGFWTQTPVEAKKRLYGPSGPMPSREDTEWVQALYEPLEGDNDDHKTRIGSPSKVPEISPVWEAIQSTGRLPIPSGVDHRFFVQDPSTCFRRSLYERDEFDEVEHEDEDYKDDTERGED